MEKSFSKEHLKLITNTKNESKKYADVKYFRCKDYRSFDET